MVMKTIHAIFENGVFRPTEAVDLPERCEVEVEVKRVQPADSGPASASPGLARIYAILGERYDSGHADTAERHNEHQP
jgi:predicted DNA-binding antitoxin AbrB/MazE fold protein